MKELAVNLIRDLMFRASLNDLIIISKDGDVVYEPNRPCLAYVSQYSGQIKTLIVDTRFDTLDIYGREWFSWLVNESVFNAYKPHMEVIEVDDKIFLSFDCEGLNWNSLFTFLVAIRELYEDSLMIKRLTNLLAIKGCTREEAWLVSHLISNLESHSCLNDITLENAVKFVKGGFKLRIEGEFLRKKPGAMTPYVWGGESWGSDLWNDMFGKLPNVAYLKFKEIIKDVT